MSTQATNRKPQAAFTLVELLVVITIIVILIALLLPAMERAIYQAELAVCGSKLHTIATSAVVYASASKRYYPHRPGVHDPALYWQPSQLYNGNDALNALNTNGNNRLQKYDDRLLLRQFLNINATLNDPLVAKVDLDRPPDVQAAVYGSYALWFSWRYVHANGGKGMLKLGDRFEWRGDRYNLLASDHDMLFPSGAAAVNTNHPDTPNMTYNVTLQEGGWDIGLGQNATFSLTTSVWIRDGDPRRGTVDLNFAYDDGSVRRDNGVKWNDPEMDFIPEWNNARSTGTVTVPPQ